MHMMNKEVFNMAKVHHILADGREVDSVKGHVINISEFPVIANLIRKANAGYIEDKKENEEKRA